MSSRLAATALLTKLRRVSSRQMLFSEFFRSAQATAWHEPYRFPLEYRDACQLLLQGTSRAIDVGQVNERYFFATSGIGFDAHVGKRYNEHPGHSRGILPYIHIAAAEYFHYTPREITFAYQGKSFTCTPFVLTVANVEQYGAGAIIAPDAIPDDGLFDVVIIPQTPLLRTVYHLPRLFNGTIDALPDFITHRTASLTITRPEPGPVHVDGETFVAGEVLEYTLLPHALRVQVPEHVVPRSKPPKPGKPFSGDTVELLEKLVRLKERGILTEEEFQEQKRKLLERL